MTNSTPVPNAFEAELERAWSVLSQSADASRRVALPIHLLRTSPESWDHRRAAHLIQVMRDRSWLRVDHSLKGLRAVYLLRKTEGVLMVTTLAVIKETVEAQPSAAPLPSKTSTTPETPREPTAREIDGVLYEDVLRRLLAGSFRCAWDGYVPLSTCLEKLYGVDLDAEETLKTLVAKGYCSVYVIRGDSLEDASFPCPLQNGARIVVSIDDIPVAPPEKNQNGEKTVNGSASYRDPFEAPEPFDLTRIETVALPTWHPCSDWHDVDAKESSSDTPLITPLVQKGPPTDLSSESLCARVEREEGEVEDACYQALRSAMQPNGAVHGHMAVLAPVFNQHGVHSTERREEIVERLIDKELIGRRGRSSVNVFVDHENDHARQAPPAPAQPVATVFEEPATEAITVFVPPEATPVAIVVEEPVTEAAAEVVATIVVREPATQELIISETPALTAGEVEPHSAELSRRITLTPGAFEIMRLYRLAYPGRDAGDIISALIIQHLGPRVSILEAALEQSYKLLLERRSKTRDHQGKPIVYTASTILRCNPPLMSLEEATTQLACMAERGWIRWVHPPRKRDRRPQSYIVLLRP